MRRTVTIKVNVEDAEAYADAIEKLWDVPGVETITWTRGHEIKAILESRGRDISYGKGSVFPPR